MIWFANSFFAEFSILLTTFAIIFLSWVKWKQNYWQRKGLITPEITYLLGNCKSIFAQKESFAEFSLNLYSYFKKNKLRHGGFYLLLMPAYMPVDLDIIKNILQTSFSSFMDRGVYSNESVDPLSVHLFSLEGSKWKNLRAKLTPTFTSGKMKMMFETLVKCGDQLIIEMNKYCGKKAVNIKDLLAGYTTDVIGNCAFGIDCNSLENPNNEFTKYMNKFFTPGFWKNMTDLLAFTAPEVMRKLGIRAINTDISKFFMEIVKETVEFRENNNIHRKDFMHLLLQLKNRGELVDDGCVLKKEGDMLNKEKITLSLNEITAQAFLFFVAGFETSSTAMTFCLYELAKNPNIQQKLADEVDSVLKKYDNKLTYEAVLELTYMDKVVYETLRKYPPLPSLNRICNKEYNIPGTNFTIEKGTKLIIPVLGIHYDPEYYPNPEKFDPERFSEENKKLRHPYSFLPFGEGPRICIGLRFGMMQTKVGLCMLLKNYNFFINSQTKQPLAFDPRSFIMSPQGGIWLDYSSRIQIQNFSK